MKKNKKNLILMLLMLIVCGMGIGYSILSRELKIEGTATIDPNFDVAITDIRCMWGKTETNSYSSGVGGSYVKSAENSAPTFTSTTANFDITLDDGIDSLAYVVTIKNNGDISAIVDSVSVNKTGSEAIILDTPIEVEGLRLKPNDEIKYIVNLTYDKTKELNNNNLKANVSVTFDVKQDIENTGEKLPNYPVYLTFAPYNFEDRLIVIYPVITHSDFDLSDSMLYVSIDNGEFIKYEDYIWSYTDNNDEVRVPIEIKYYAPTNLELGEHVIKFKLIISGLNSNEITSLYNSIE